MEIRNALVYCEDHKFRKGDIEICGELISRVQTEEIKTGGDYVLDAHDLYAIPGLVDVHFHGANGYDFCDGNEESIQEIARYEAEHGVLAICPATMTFPEERLMKVMRAAAAHKNGSGADLVGIHMEGPFVSSEKLGAQNPAFAHAPDIAMVRRLAKASNGLLKIVDIAPELPGAESFIREVSKDVVVSVSHTCADYETAQMAFRSGATHLTHTFDAMPDLQHRAPGPIPAALEAGADAELIADGIHVHFACSGRRE